MEKVRFTAKEAEEYLKQENCREVGHNFGQTADRVDNLVSVWCVRCGAEWKVMRDE